MQSKIVRSFRKILRRFVGNFRFEFNEPHKLINASAKFQCNTFEGIKSPLSRFDFVTASISLNSCKINFWNNQSYNKTVQPLDAQLIFIYKKREGEQYTVFSIELNCEEVSKATVISNLHQRMNDSTAYG